MYQLSYQSHYLKIVSQPCADDNDVVFRSRANCCKDLERYFSQFGSALCLWLHVFCLTYS